jgi:hypothetical protein
MALIELNRWWHRLREVSPQLVGAVLCLAVAALYLTTIQVDVSGSSDRYMKDVTEFQLVLNLWGTAHPTGYPLYALLGNIFTQAVRALGVSPAGSASLFSLVWAAGAGGLVYAIGVALTGRRWLSALPAALLAASRTFWLHGVIAEVYSFSVFLAALTLWLAIRLEQTRQGRYAIWLGLVLGLAMVHHRALALLIPGLAAYLWPVLRRLPFRVWLVSAAVCILTFGVYLYLPLSGWAGSPWVYGQPDTWSGFWGIVGGSEYDYLMQPPDSLAEGLRHLVACVRIQVTELTLPGLLLGGLGFVVALSTRRQTGLGRMLIIGYLAFLIFATYYYKAVLTYSVLMPATLLACVGAILVLDRLGRTGQAAGGAAAVLTTGLIVYLIVANRSFVLNLTRDPQGRELIEAVAQAGDSQTTVVTTWGKHYFALNYARYLEPDFPPVELILYREDLKALLMEGRRLYAPVSLFYLRGLADWDSKLGRAYLSSGGWNLIEVRDRPRTMVEGDVQLLDARLGEVVSLLGFRATHEGQAVHLTLYWRAEQTIPMDYSVSVKLTDREAITGPEDIIAQQDSRLPVYGWYPTSRWTPGEVVREDYRISLPDGRTPTQAVVSMYTYDPAGGNFDTLGVVYIPLYFVNES